MRRLLLLLIPFVGFASVSLASVNVAPGDAFPEIRIEGLITPDDYANLGLSRSDGPFPLSDVPGDVLVLEIFNKQCLPCRRQVRYVEAFFQEIRSAGLSSRIQLLGMAEGNQAKYFSPFRKKYKLNFPIAADPKFAYWHAFGKPGRTPLTIFLVRRQERWVFVQAHAGVEDKNWLMTVALAHLRGEAVTETENESPGEDLADWPRPLEPDVEKEFAEKLLSRAAGSQISAEILEIEDRGRVYRATLPGDAGRLYARVARREPLCEICHGVYFGFVFDQRGRIRGFEPIFAGKWGNVPWDAEDSAFFESRLWGRNLEALAFDEMLDAVSSATVTSAIVFDEIRESMELLKALEKL